MIKKLTLLSLAALTLASCGTSSSASKTSASTLKLSSPKVTSSAKELVRVTDDVVAEFQPSLSPDGKQLLYVIRDDANEGYNKWSIRLKKNVMMPGFTPLIGKKTDRPSWIDNNNIIFTYYASKPTIATSALDRLGLTYIGQNAYGDFDADAMVSPNGERIVLTTDLQGTRSICLVNRDGNNFTVLSEGNDPKWHPSGEKLLYTKLSGDYVQLFELDLNSYQSTQITTGESHCTFGAYSPDGRRIAFISSKDDYGHLYFMKANGTGLTQLTSGQSNEAQPFWGTDGFIYFASTAGARTPEASKEKKKMTFAEKLASKMNKNKKQDEEVKDHSLAAFSYPYTDIWRVKPIIIESNHGGMVTDKK